jgi:hypothetical protein
MSPAKQITNPLAEEGETADNGNLVLVIEYDSAGSGNLVNGTVVAIETVASATGVTKLIKKVTTTPDFLMLGVIVDAPTGGVAPGQAAHVLVEGIAPVLFDANNTTAGHLALQSSTTAGSATDSATATLGKTLGTILASVTISSGTALVDTYVHKM